MANRRKDSSTAAAAFASDGGEVFFSLAIAAADDRRKTFAIPRACLNAAPDSLLSALADAKWKSGDPGLGDDEATPIATEPLDDDCPVRHVWLKYADVGGRVSAVLPKLIVDAYRFRWAEEVGKVVPRLALPKGLEFKDAWDFLDYYGLHPGDPASIVVPTENNVDVAVRARLFLLFLKKAFPFLKQAKFFAAKAKDMIVADLLNDAAHSKFYVFAHRDDSEDVMKFHNPDVFSVIRDVDFDLRHKWLESPRFRQQLEDLLKDENLEACFVTADGFGFVTDGFGFYSVPILVRNRFVLSVTIPRAPEKPRISV